LENVSLASLHHSFARAITALELLVAGGVVVVIKATAEEAASAGGHR
jgi:hypothetical protein